MRGHAEHQRTAHLAHRFFLVPASRVIHPLAVQRDFVSLPHAGVIYADLHAKRVEMRIEFPPRGLDHRRRQPVGGTDAQRPWLGLTPAGAEEVGHAHAVVDCHHTRLQHTDVLGRHVDCNGRGSARLAGRNDATGFIDRGLAIGHRPQPNQHDFMAGGAAQVIGNQDAGTHGIVGQFISDVVDARGLQWHRLALEAHGQPLGTLLTRCINHPVIDRGQAIGQCPGLIIGDRECQRLWQRATDACLQERFGG
ncbi:hypothetical protein D3C80_411950 [compost metagenome]